jgi:Transglutaminase-like superfamily/TgpA N-terminal domain
LSDLSLWMRSRRTSPEWREAVAESPALLGVAAATFLAALPFLRDYRVGGAVALLVVASLAPVVVALVCGVIWRLAAAFAYALSAVGLLLLLLVSMGPHAGDIARELSRAPNRLLTQTLPLGGARATMAAVVVLTWLCAAAASELLIRGRRTGYGVSMLALALPVGLFVLSYAVSASAPGSNTAVGPLLLLVLATTAVARHRETEAPVVSVGGATGNQTDERPPKNRGVMVGAIIAIAVAAAAALVVTAVPSSNSKPVSLHRPAPTAASVVVDPVDSMAQLRDGNPHAPASREIQIDLNGASTGYLSMAVLDEYDGAVWQFIATFQPTGGRIPSAGSNAAPLDNSTVTQHVTLEGQLPIALLPALDRPAAVAGLAVAADPETGMFLPVSAKNGLFTYTAVSRAPDVTIGGVPPADGVAAASSPGAAISHADLQLPAGTSSALATTLRFLSSLTGERPAPSVAFLQSVVNVLHADEKRVDPTLVAPPTPPAKAARRSSAATTTTVPASAKSIGGTSLSQAINAVTVNRSATPEQFATLVAMVARYLGVPARVVTGFRVAPSSAGHAIGPGSYQVTNRQAWAWVEIPVAGLGWVVADPTPDATTAVSAPPPEQVQAPPTTLPPKQANAVPRSEITGGHPLAPRAPVKIPVHHQIPWWLAALIALLGVLAILALAGPGLATARRAWRRRSRRSADPVALAVGAWLELLDGLEQAGMATPTGSTTSEVAGEAAIHFSPDVAAPVRVVGAVADQAIFSPAGPPDTATAESAWETQRALRRTVRRGLDRRQRLRAVLSVGSSTRRPAVPGPSSSGTNGHR